MAKRILPILLLIFAVILLSGCDYENPYDIPDNINRFNDDLGGQVMNFQFQTIQDIELIYGTSYLMDFGEMTSQEDAAIVEGKLLSVFGQPVFKSESYENSFNYIIRATADNGESVILTVYGMGVVHIGSSGADDFTVQAANALVEYVNAAEPTDYERTVYYLDYDLQIDIEVKNGKASIRQSQMSEEKIDELFDKFY